MSNYINVKENCTTNGEGVRTALFLSGCPGVLWNKKTKRYDHCPGCFNSAAWDFKVGKQIDGFFIFNVLVKSIAPDYIDGLSILGGEPMCVDNQKAVWEIIDIIRKVYQGRKTIWLWTGYELSKNPFNKNRIPRTKFTKSILKNIDALVDGHFDKDKFDIDLRFRGSSNQRILFRGRDF